MREEALPEKVFAPGAIFASRYRIISPVGQGGMGIVYRADDLKLGHPIALKFVPQELTDSPARLNYLYSEVRNARQVAHPNVCRVYDIGEHSGRHFLSMEYVDGEDLASLLKRIGRLPVQKAMDLSLKIFAGLDAAHNRNIVHRDLKPANIMLDGQGQARIMDFGLSFELGEKDTGDIMWWIRGGIAFFLFDALYIWIVYVAAEPAIRRFLPDAMVSWNRLLAGRIRDPLIGRNLLIGAVSGALIACIL